MKIAILPDNEARLIAAGEVIERPAGALRELLDNALDSGTDDITVWIEGGGSRLIRVEDSGEGMDEGDLRLSILPHATGKIRALIDLDSIYSLGFRGEALASMAACATLEIESAVAGGGSMRMQAKLGQVVSMEPVAPRIGSSVTVRELFYNMPARKRFLKSAGVETRECQNIFFERALAFPHVQFKFYVDGTQKYCFPKESLKERVQRVFPGELGLNPLLLRSETSRELDGYAISAVCARPENARGDRRFIHIYVNGRRIIEYPLVQAVVYACDAMIPGGRFPVCFVFIEERADLVDFNIHPAKREAKLRNGPILHKAIVSLMKERLAPIYGEKTSIFRPLDDSNPGFFREFPRESDEKRSPKSNMSEWGISLPRQPSGPTGGTEGVKYFIKPQNPTPESIIIETSSSAVQSIPFSAADFIKKFDGSVTIKKDDSEERVPKNRMEEEGPWRYIGQLMGVFLLVEKNGALFLIDQHAAHERILFDGYASQTPVIQRFLTPITLDLTTDEAEIIISAREELARSGVEIAYTNDKVLQILAAPDYMKDDFWREFVKRAGGSVTKELHATRSCREAIKEGEILSREEAIKLVRATFALPQPFCPHGRPVWIELDRDQLYKWVKRII